MDLAALLTLPEILQILLSALEGSPEATHSVPDENDILKTAHQQKILSFDSTSLQSRLVRCGRCYRKSVLQTLRLLKERQARLVPQ